ncbi:MAG: cysteine-rich CWC family protein [Piscinibacter sp.]|nr:cysteine-rich CWC family protein [Piscinibacter sp.]
MADASAAANARCPRCSAAFHCGAAERHCACAEVALDDAARAAIAQRYTGCLCGECLRALRDAPSEETR